MRFSQMGRQHLKHGMLLLSLPVITMINTGVKIVIFFAMVIMTIINIMMIIMTIIMIIINIIMIIINIIMIIINVIV